MNAYVVLALAATSIAEIPLGVTSVLNVQMATRLKMVFVLKLMNA
jgi:hypothetical protein